MGWCGLCEAQSTSRSPCCRSGVCRFLPLDSRAVCLLKASAEERDGSGGAAVIELSQALSNTRMPAPMFGK